MIPSWISITLLIVTFYMLAHQYRRIVTKNNIVNLRFGLMVSALVLIVLVAFLSRHHPHLSPIFFILALVWFAAGVQLWRLMPPVPPIPSRY